MLRRIVLSGWLLLGGSALGADANWPQFRGPVALPIADDAGLPDAWSDHENVLWTQPIAGRGWSSPIVWGERVFLTTAVSEGELEPPKKGIYLGGNRPQAPTSVHHWHVLCLDLATGRIVWDREVHSGQPESSIHIKNSYASETPATDGEHVYAYFGNVGLFCLDLAGQIVWQQRWPALAIDDAMGTASSPVLHGDRLYITNDNDSQSYLVALDKRTGKEIWRVPRDDRSNWATPFIWQNEQRTEIVANGTEKVSAYDLEGKLLWQFGGMSRAAVPTPFAHHGLLYVASGHTMAKRKPVVAIRAGATGDITLPDKETTGPFVAWKQKMAAPYNPSILAYRDHVYSLLDGGIISCFDASTGEAVFPKTRVPDGKAFTASPWAYDGRVFCLNEDGITFVLDAGSQFKVLSTNRLAEDDMCMATPALAGDKLLIRTAARVYCIAKGAMLAKREQP